MPAEMHSLMSSRLPSSGEVAEPALSTNAHSPLKPHRNPSTSSLPALEIGLNAEEDRLAPRHCNHLFIEPPISIYVESSATL